MLVAQKIEINSERDKLIALLQPVRAKCEELGYEADVPAPQGHLNHAVEVTDSKSGLFFLLELFEEDNELAVYPPPASSLEDDQAWNKMISAFYRDIVTPVCAANGITTHRITSDSKTIQDCFSKPLVALLETTVHSPRGTTTRFKAWTEFLVCAAIESGETKDDCLSRWLEQDAKQPEDEVNSMLADYHTAHWIMSEYFRLYSDAPPTERHYKPEK